jgi:ABC transporter transmembrane region
MLLITGKLFCCSLVVLQQLHAFAYVQSSTSALASRIPASVRQAADTRCCRALRDPSDAALRLPFSVKHSTSSGCAAQTLLRGAAVVDALEDEEGDAIRKRMASLVYRDGGRWALVQGVFLAVAATVASLGMPLGFANVLTALLDPLDPARSGRLTRAALGVGTLYLLEPALSYLYVRHMTHLNEKVAARLRTDTFKAILSQSMGFFDARQVSQVTSAVTSDIAAVRTVVSTNLQKDRGLRAVLEASLGLVVLTVLQPRLAWIFGLVIPTVAFSLAESRKALLVKAARETASLAHEVSALYLFQRYTNHAYLNTVRSLQVSAQCSSTLLLQWHMLFRYCLDYICDVY